LLGLLELKTTIFKLHTGLIFKVQVFCLQNYRSDSTSSVERFPLLLLGANDKNMEQKQLTDFLQFLFFKHKKPLVGTRFAV